MSIAKCYARSSVLIKDPDSLEVVEAVEGYRRFWKPQEVRVVLLAESHVHTSKDDFAHQWSFGTQPSYEGRFVRFVYCLAYGERSLASLPTNRGTWQYWKILYSCLNQVSENNDFAPILKGRTPNLHARMSNKIQLLNELQHEGIWLLDASIIAINGLAQNLKDQVTRTCWKLHTGPLLRSLDPKPERVLVIGSGVAKTLQKAIIDIGFTCKVIPQPQARDRRGYLKHYQTCFDFCNPRQL